jgi:hypothetical protein
LESAAVRKLIFMPRSIYSKYLTTQQNHGKPPLRPKKTHPLWFENQNHIWRHGKTLALATLPVELMKLRGKAVFY